MVATILMIESGSSFDYGCPDFEGFNASRDAGGCGTAWPRASWAPWAPGSLWPYLLFKE